MLPRQRRVAAGVGGDLRAVQGDGPQLQEVHLPGDHQHLHEQALDLGQEPPAEAGQGVVVGMGIGGDEPERHRVMRRPLDLAAGKRPRRVAVDQKRQQHRWMMRRRPSPRVPAHQPAQVQPLDDLHHEPRKVVVRQPVPHRRRQQVGRFPVSIHKTSHQRDPLKSGESSHQLQPPESPTGC